MDKEIIPGLVYTGAHLGHKTQNWHPKMKPFIYKTEKNTHIIDVVQTSLQLKKACEFLFKMSLKDIFGNNMQLNKFCCTLMLYLNFRTAFEIASRKLLRDILSLTGH